MANTDLVKKKPVALEVATYKRLSDLAAQLRIDNPGGGFVSMSTAVERLLNLWDAWKEEQQKGAILEPENELAAAAIRLRAVLWFSATKAAE